jgi:hypothetical protein
MKGWAFCCHLFYIDDIEAQLPKAKDNILGTGVHRKVQDNCLDRLIGVWEKGEVVDCSNETAWPYSLP